MKLSGSRIATPHQRFFEKVLNRVKHIKTRAIALKRNNFPSKSEAKLRWMIKSRIIAIIPAGFRCFTKDHIYENLNFTQRSLPFDNGFFPPSAVVSVIKNPIIKLEYNDNNSTHFVCQKYENYEDPVMGRGIKFQKSSYEEINSLANDRDMDEINRYLDASFGYYTLDVAHNFVLAHYNWHKFSEKSAICAPNINLENINKILNKRIRIMFELCNLAEYIFFVVGEFQEYKFMMIDDRYYDLHCFGALADTIASAFNAQCFAVKVADVNSADKLLAMIN